MIRVDASCDCCGREVTTGAKSVAGGLVKIKKAGWVYVLAPPGEDNLLLCERCAEAVGILVKCPGEAHEIIRRGGDQDHCGVCAPRWDQVAADPVPSYKQIKERFFAAILEQRIEKRVVNVSDKDKAA